MIPRLAESGLSERQVLNSGARGGLVQVHGCGDSGLPDEDLIIDRGLTGWSDLVPDLCGFGTSPCPPLINKMCYP